MTEERLNRIKNVLSKRQPDLTVLLDRVNKPHNVSAILRSCDSVGVLEAHAVTIDKNMPTFSATSASADKWVKLNVHSNIKGAVSILKDQNFQLIATKLSANSVDYREIDYTKPTCIILGSEKFGVSDESAELSDQNMIIPMYGMVPSLNVSVAAAVILFEASRQRAKAGFYDSPRLKDMDKWLHEWSNRLKHGSNQPVIDGD